MRYRQSALARCASPRSGRSRRASSTLGVGVLLQILARPAKAIKKGQDRPAPGMGEGKSRIERDRLTVERLGLLIIRDRKRRAVVEFPSPQIENVGIGIPGRSISNVVFLAGTERRIEGGGDGGREFSLQSNDIGQSAIVGFRPKLVAVARIDQRDVKHDPISRAIEASFQNVAHPERSADRCQIAPASRRKTRGTEMADHLQIPDLHEAGKNVVLDPLGEKGVGRVVCQIAQGQRRQSICPGAVRWPRKDRLRARRRRATPSPPRGAPRRVPSHRQPGGRTTVRSSRQRWSNSPKGKRGGRPIFRIGREHRFEQRDDRRRDTARRQLRDGQRPFPLRDRRAHRPTREMAPSP